VSDTDLLRAIRSALEHAAKTNAVRSELGAIHLRVERLTPREREVMMLVVTGILNKQVAEELGTVVKAIKAHRARVMEKMEVTSLAKLGRLTDRARLGGAASARALR
jgi:FixJ family two-component response regulator